jgi:energy-coupling factor transporter transmembrane protein EcfT
MFELIVHYALGNIPDWVWPAAAGGAFVVWFFAGVISHIPQFSLYAKFIKPVAFIAMLVGVFMYGGQGVVAVYKADVIEAQHKADIADEKAKAANAALSQAVANNKHLIEGRAYGVRQIIIKDADKINADCNKINSDAWEDYNRAIKNLGSKILTGDKK